MHTSVAVSRVNQTLASTLEYCLQSRSRPYCYSSVERLIECNKEFYGCFHLSYETCSAVASPFPNRALVVPLRFPELSFPVLAAL